MKINFPVVIKDFLIQNRKLILQTLLLTFFAVVYEITVSLYTLSLASHQITFAILFSALCPFLSFLSYHWLVETNNLKERIVLTVGTALGYGLGTWLALLIF